MRDSDGAAPASSTPTPNASAAPRADRERRQHHRLRDLIDEMMASLRVAANRDVLTAEERADAERQLAQIMARVHEEAVKVGDRAGR